MPVDVNAAKAIFMSALEKIEPAERAAYVSEACGHDAVLRQRVEILLKAHEDPASFMKSPLAGSAAAMIATIDDPIRERAGTVIGPYKLLEQIGEGGFGVVFMAEQSQPVRRKVALKVLKPGMDSRQIVARFEAERQALALMDHTNIARVFDGGETPTGRPYFVMELVKGVPITEFCDKNHSTAWQRLELFLPVCQAVQHAHQKGIIHRDLKPSNVLVSRHDTTPIVKVIDFGVAKALGQELTDKTLFTGIAQMIGTPLYMSPEQAGMSDLDIDTRSDIYSLGVLLYELLTGTTPFDKERLRTASYDEIRRIIREEEPIRPSTRISTLGQTAVTVSANRQSDPKKLGQLVRGELDWIVMKALEKDRNRRYESASAFAADVQRYLHEEPVQACPPSRWYRLGKVARRNKRTLATAALLGVMLLVAAGAVLASALWAAFQATERLQAEAAAKNKLEEALYVSHTALAGRELAAGNVGRAEELLDDCPEYLRGWEWHFLKRQRFGNANPLRHSSTVTHVAFSPDGRNLASGCLDGTVNIWDARSGLALRTFQKEAAITRDLAYSSDGRYLAAAYQNGAVCVWNVATGELLATLRGHQKEVWQVAFSPDGHSLASAAADRTVKIWDFGGKAEKDVDRLIRVLPEHPAEVKGVAFSPDGDHLLTACSDGTVKTHDLATGQEVASFRGQLLYDHSAHFSPDARRLAWACQDGLVKVWDTATGQEEIAQQSNTQVCRCVAFSPDGRRIAVAGFDGTLRLLEGATGREMLTIFAHPSLVAGVAFSPDGRRLASASYDHTVRFWDATPLSSDPETGQCITLARHKQTVNSVAFSPDDRWLASASEDGMVNIWELLGQSIPETAASRGIALRYTLRGHSGNIIGVAFSSDRRTVASASWDNTVKLWDLQAPIGDSLTERGTIRRTRRPTSIAFSPDGALLAIGQQGGIALYDPATGKEVHPFKPTHAPVPEVTFGPDGRLYSAGASDPVVKVWNVAATTPLFEIPHYANPNATVAVSPDGRLIASPGRVQEGHVVKIWDAQSRAELRTLKGHLGYVWKAAFSPDGRYLASGSWDSTVKIWDLKAPESTEPVTLRGHAGFIRGLAFSPDGKRLASASGSAGHGEIKVWDASLWKNKANGGARLTGSP